MNYKYGLQGFPRASGAGTVSEKLNYAAQATFTRIVTPGSGTVNPPSGARFMRVAVVGGGGGAVGGTGGGGGGGGCAASKMVVASSVSYTVGAGGSSSDGGDSIAIFPGYRLFAGGGKSGSTRSGGTASGGDYNSAGGAGTERWSSGDPYAGGGGAAGPFSLVNGVYTGWGATRGGDGAVNYRESCGGSGTGALGPAFITTYYQRIVVPAGMNTNWPWGIIPSGSFEITGGEMGGGGGRDSSFLLGSGGSGGLVVEWFY